MLRTIVMAALSAVIAACATPTHVDLRTDHLAAWLKDANHPGAFVVAHRACWREAPENSIAAIKECIRLGVDIVEIDVRTTADGVLVLHHDADLARMTGNPLTVSAVTLADISGMRLRKSDGGTGIDFTEERPPTLREALEAARGQLIVHLDVKEGPDAWPQIWNEVASLGMTRQVLMKITEPASSPAWRDAPFSDALLVRSRIIPSGGASGEQICELMRYRPVAHTVQNFSDTSFVQGARRAAQSCGGRLWVATHGPQYAAGLTDTSAAENPDAVWGRFWELGFTVFETDTPEVLIAYLESIGRRAEKK